MSDTVDNRQVITPELAGAQKLQSRVARRVIPMVLRGTIRPLWASKVPISPSAIRWRVVLRAWRAALMAGLL